MWTEQGVVSDMTLTKLTPSTFVSDDNLNDSSFPWKPWLLPKPSHFMSYDSDSSFFRAVLEPESLAALPYPSAQTSLDFRQCGNGHTMQMDYASGHDTRRAIALLDTRKWSPSPSFVAPYAPSGSHFAFMDVRSHAHASLPHLDGGSNGFTESFSFDGTLPPDIGSKAHVILHTQPPPVPDFGSSFSSLVMGYRHENLARTTFPENSMLVPSSSFSGSTEDRANFFSDETQPPTVLFRPQEKKGSHRQRGTRASAINIEGLWIDKADLYSIIGQGSNMIGVHECQWAKTSNPCGMWIVGSRARIGGHIRKWHRHTHAASRTQCLWDSCTAKPMQKDSISRHVVTVHLGEGFHCQGCNERFSRKDVYAQHVQKGELCRDADVVMVYGAECKVIDTREALQQGDAVRYAD